MRRREEGRETEEKRGYKHQRQPCRQPMHCRWYGLRWDQVLRYSSTPIQGGGKEDVRRRGKRGGKKEVKRGKEGYSDDGKAEALIV